MINQSNTNMKTRKITVTAVMTALVFVITWLVKVPVPGAGGAYLNFGDIVIYLAAYLLGGPLAVLPAAVGSLLADLAVGSAVYALPTFVIKGLMALVAGVIMKKRKMVFYFLGCLAGGAIMVAGYALFEYMFFDTTYMLAALPFNFLQMGGSVGMALIFYKTAKNIDSYLNIQSHRT